MLEFWYSKIFRQKPVLLSSAMWVCVDHTNISTIIWSETFNFILVTMVIHMFWFGTSAKEAVEGRKSKVRREFGVPQKKEVPWFAHRMVRGSLWVGSKKFSTHRGVRVRNSVKPVCTKNRVVCVGVLCCGCLVTPTLDTGKEKCQPHSFSFLNQSLLCACCKERTTEPKSRLSAKKKKKKKTQTHNTNKL